MARIKLAGEELEKVVKGAPDANPAIGAAAGYLFRPNAHEDVARRLKQLYQTCGGIRRSDMKNERTMDRDGDTDHPAWNREWKKLRRKNDDIVGCSSSS